MSERTETGVVMLISPLRKRHPIRRRRRARVRRPPRRSCPACRGWSRGRRSRRRSLHSRQNPSPRRRRPRRRSSSFGSTALIAEMPFVPSTLAGKNFSAEAPSDRRQEGFGRREHAGHGDHAMMGGALHDARVDVGADQQPAAGIVEVVDLAHGQHRAGADQRRFRQRFRQRARSSGTGRASSAAPRSPRCRPRRPRRRLRAPRRASRRAGSRRGGAGVSGTARSWQGTFGSRAGLVARPAEALRRLEQAGADGFVGVGLQHGAAGELQRRGVERAERAGCDQDDLAGRRCRKRGGPRRSRRRSAGPTALAAASSGLQILQQRRGADAEERGTDIAALPPARPSQAATEDRVVGQGRRGALAERVAQDRLLGKDGEQLAGQPGPEAGNDAVRRPRPISNGCRACR